MGLVHDDGNVAYSDGSLRVVDGDGQRLADDIDPRPYWDYIGEAVEPWSYLKSTYWKQAGYPDGLYRVGPLARLNVVDRLGTDEADDELAGVPRALGPVPVQLVPLPLRPADRDPPLHRDDRTPARRRRTSSTRTCSPAPTSTATRASAWPKRHAAR